MAYFRNYKWELIAENAFRVVFKIAEVLPGYVWCERCQGKPVFSGQCSGLSEVFSMEKRPESQLGFKVTGERVITHQRHGPQAISEQGRIPENSAFDHLALLESGIYCTQRT